MPELPSRPSLEHLRKQAKARKREQRIPLSRAQFTIAREYGFDSWPRLVRQARAAGLTGAERALVLADPDALAEVLRADPAAATVLIGEQAPLMLLLDSHGSPADLRACARLLLEHGAEADEDVFYHACEHADNELLDLLYRPGYEGLVNHKLDFEDTAGLRWFLEHGTDVNACYCLHHAISRGRGMPILTMLLDAGADVNLPWDRWDVGRRPLALAARCGHLAAYDLIAARGGTAELDPVDAAVLAVARGESVRLPTAPPPALGNPCGEDYGWILGQFALLGRTEVVRSLLDAGMSVDTRGWSNFTPLDQAAMHGRTGTVRLLLERGADVTDRAFDEEGPTPLDCALWGRRNNPAEDGDYLGTVRLLLAADAPTLHLSPTGDAEIDRELAAAGRAPLDPRG
ncbi:ankyrin repeat domain-containing protein [Amycolatopsis cihanbeyliensis]|uniref:Ankyrin repeat protein n=1 Tax=Amycolatopsis cihanbeyliensis TaxID=1128664 RepID=A0A542DI90_AMYCI|nr:ankyrin repeat domain-containing protein [Amycolatopsis cihanbeyliensis]TQJ02811.1 ankyrin repeat protein [Amycolatopsis cihanbeyliensis]